MLVLTRRIGDTIKIGKDVEIRLVSLEGSRVQLGVTAPKVLPFNKDEIYKRLCGDSRPD